AASWLIVSTPLAAIFEEATSASTLPRVRSASSSTILALFSAAALARSLTSPKAARNCSAAIWPVSAALLVVLAMVLTPVLMLRTTLAAARTGFGAGFAAGRTFVAGLEASWVALVTGLAAGWGLRATTGFFAGLALV